MKFFHISDLHIGLNLMNYDLSEDQKYILDQIVDQAAKEKPDAVLIAGDIYNKAVPSAEAVTLFDDFMVALHKAVPDAVIMAISGNHDSAPRVDLYRKILADQNMYMIGLPPMEEDEHIQKVTLTDDYGPVNFYLLPFVKPSMVKKIVGVDEKGNNLSYDESLRRLIDREEVDTSQRNVLVSHQFYLPVGKNADDIPRMDSEVRTVGNIDEVSAEVLSAFDYAAIGHIHKPMKVGSEVYRYCGTPLACSVSEEGQNKHILMITMDGKDDQPQVDEIPLKPMRQVRRMEGLLEDVLTHGSDDYVSITLTDDEDLQVVDMQARLRHAFPHLLEIRRANIRQADYELELEEAVDMDPFKLVCDFLKVADDEEQEIIRDVINTVMEEEA